MNQKPSTLRVPRNKSAAMQHLLTLIVRGYECWTSGVVAREKAHALAQKFAALYGTDESAQRRSRNRAKGHASAHVIFFAIDDMTLAWWLVATPGRGPVHEMERLKHAKAPAERLSFLHYELIYRQRTRHQGGGAGWTWRLQAEGYRDWEYHLVSAARKYDAHTLEGAVRALLHLPMFAGVREQVQRLFARAERVWSRSGEKFSMHWPRKLPFMTRIRIYSVEEGEATNAVEASAENDD